METIIDLDKLEKNTALGKDELIYREECGRLCDTIRRKVKHNVGTAKRIPDELVCQPCFFINGGRGSGKTTLLRAVRRELASLDSELGVRIVELASIDPTELAETENFFIHILGRIQKSLKDIQSRASVTEEEKAHIRTARMSIDKMSRGLGLLIRRPEHGGNPADSGFIVQQSVEDCVSGFELKHEFAKLVEVLCQLKNVDALLVTVDDADMNFSKCSEVLETVRKYLINARMVFVFAGDLKLYTMVVRGMQMNHFGNLSLAHDKKREEHRYQLLDVLEDQYAMKLFPVDNRIELSDFSIVYDKQPIIRYLHQGEQRPREEKIDAFIENILSRVFKGSFQQVLWLSYMKKLSTRSALQLLAHWAKCKNDKNAMIWWRDGIKNVVLHSLIKLKIATIESRNMSLGNLLQTITSFVKVANMGESGAALLPGMGDASQQMVSFYLSAEAVCRVRNLYDALFYILDIFPRLQCGSKLPPYFQDGGSEADFPRLFQLGADCTAMMLPAVDVKKAQIRYFGNGVVPLFSQHQLVDGSDKERRSVKEVISELQKYTEQHDEPAVLKFVLAINAAFSRVVENGVSICCLSIYNLIARLLVLLRMVFSVDDIKDEHIRNILVMGFDFVPTAVRGGVVERSGMPDVFIGYPDASWVDFSFLKDEKYQSAIDTMVVDIKKWGNEVKKWALSVHPVSFYNSWSHLFRDCMIATNEAKLKATDVESLVGAADLSCRYITSMVTSTIHIRGEKNSTMFSLLSSCPLLKVWEDEHGRLEKGEVYQLLNSVNIGPVGITISKKRAEEICDYWLDEMFDEIKSKVNNTLEASTNDHIVNGVEEWWSGVLQDARERFVSECYHRMEERQNSQEQEVDSKKIGKWAKTFVDSFILREQGLKTAYSKKVMAAKKSCFSDFVAELETRRELFKSLIRSRLETVENEDDFERKILSRELRRERGQHRAAESKLNRVLQKKWGQISTDVNKEIVEIIKERINQNLARKKW